MGSNLGDGRSVSAMTALLLVGAWLILQIWVLPRLGVPT
jgi:hypothetical protein